MQVTGGLTRRSSGTWTRSEAMARCARVRAKSVAVGSACCVCGKSILSTLRNDSDRSMSLARSAAANFGAQIAIRLAFAGITGFAPADEILRALCASMLLAAIATSHLDSRPANTGRGRAPRHRRRRCQAPRQHVRPHSERVRQGGGPWRRPLLRALGCARVGICCTRARAIGVIFVVLH
jgi:hypothetical protein